MSVCVAVWQAHREPNLRTLLSDLEPAGGRASVEVVVVLNGVSRPSVSLAGWVRTIDLEQNAGLPVAWNLAAREARGDVLVFCNDDVRLGPEALNDLCRALCELPEARVVGPAVGWPPPTRRKALAGPIRCEAIQGHLFAIRRRDFERVGGFDPAYSPALWEEFDLCAAVRADGGFVYAVPVDCEHDPGISARRAWPWVRIAWDGRSESLRSIRRRNRRRFLRKWGSA